jgi:hypothetical protein
MTSGVWEEVARIGGGGGVRVPEDILTTDNPLSPLRKRGRLLYSGGPENGFPGLGQHFNGSGQARPAPSVNGRSGGLIFAGMGAEADGYGDWDAGGGAYLRLARDVENVWYTFSGRLAFVGQEPGAVNGLKFYMDTQNWAGDKRAYPRVRRSTSLPKWYISGDNTDDPATETHPSIEIPDSAELLGDNEAKGGDVFWAFSFFHASDITQSRYGHFQYGGKIHDLRGLGGGYSRHPIQGAPVPFDGGLNFGFGYETPLPGKWGGICINRMEVTVGDVLV